MRRERSKTHSAASQPTPQRRPHDEAHDTYGSPGKLADRTQCTVCRSSYRSGRWTWEPAPLGSPSTVCPACRRIQDDYPAGMVVVEGAFVQKHREEIENLIRNVESREKADHPLKRIFSIDEEDGGLRIRTTDGRLAHGIGHALYHAYRGELEEDRPQSDGPVRIYWRREE